MRLDAEGLDLLAADYVLGLLEGEARTAFEAQLTSDTKLQNLVNEWEARLVEVDAQTPAVEPSAHVWEQISAQIDAAPPPGTTTIRGSDGQWETIAPGATRKRLYTDVSNGWETYLLRIEPGTTLPAHGHSSPEECYVLEGEMIIGQAAFGAGDYHFAPAGVDHYHVSTNMGALVY